MFFILWCSSCY